MYPYYKHCLKHSYDVVCFYAFTKSLHIVFQHFICEYNADLVKWAFVRNEPNMKDSLSYFALLCAPFSDDTHFSHGHFRICIPMRSKTFTKRKKKIRKLFFKKTISYSIACLPSKQRIVLVGIHYPLVWKWQPK